MVKLRRGLGPIHGMETTRYFQKWLVIAVLIGVVAGVGALAFTAAIHYATMLFLGLGAAYVPPSPAGEGSAPITPIGRPWLLPLITGFGGLISGLIVFGLAPEAEGHGTDAAISAIHFHAGRIRGRIPLIKLVASAITIGSGGSGGREGPTAQISAGFGSLLGDVFHLDDDDRRIAVAVGIGAGIGAIFHAPLGGAVLAAEILYVRDIEVEAIIPSLIASIVGYSVVGLVAGFQPLFGNQNQFGFTEPIQLVYYAALGIACGLFGILYARVFYTSTDFFRGIRRLPRPLMPAIGGLLVGCIGVFMPAAIYTGYGWVQELMGPGILGLPIWLILLLPFAKIVATSLSIGSGGSGGIFGPGMVIGAAIGASFWRLGVATLPSMPAESAPFVIIGMMALFGGIARAPLAVMLMVAEMTGNLSLLAPAMLAVGLSYLIVGDNTIYRSQIPTRADSLAHRARLRFPLLATLNVADAQTPPTALIDPHTTVDVAASMIRQESPDGAPVVDSAGKLLGILTNADLRRVEQADWGRTTVGEVMNDQPVLTFPTQSLDLALETLATGALRWLPVLADRDDPRVVGILSVSGIVNAYRNALKSTIRGISQFAGGGETIDFKVQPSSAVSGHSLAELRLAPETLVLAIRRGDESLVPGASMMLLPGDQVTVLSRGRSMKQLHELFGEESADGHQQRPVVAQNAVTVSGDGGTGGRRPSQQSAGTRQKRVLERVTGNLVSFPSRLPGMDPFPLRRDWAISRREVMLVISVVVVGLLCGLAVYSFTRLMEVASLIFFPFTWATGFSPTARAAVILLAPTVGGLLVGVGTTRFLAAAPGRRIKGLWWSIDDHSDGTLWKTVLGRALAALVTLGSGGSAGREDPIAQIGEAIGSSVGRFFRMQSKDLRTLTLCGAAGCIAAIFNAPLAGAFFVAEVLLDEFEAGALALILLAAITSSVVARTIWGSQPAFAVPRFVITGPVEFGPYLALGILAGLVSAIFVVSLQWSERGFRSLSIPSWLKPGIGGLAVGMIGLFYPLTLLPYPAIDGASYRPIGAVVGGELGIGILLALLVGKLVATSFTLGSGGVGSIFGPSLFLGATLGGAFGIVVNSALQGSVGPSGAYALLGMAAVLAAAGRAPITAIMLAFEMAGNFEVILPLMAVTSIAYLITRAIEHAVGVYHDRPAVARGDDLLHQVLLSRVMTRDFETVLPTLPLTELVQRFNETGHHGFPVVDENSRLVGIVAMSDLENSMLGSGARQPTSSEDEVEPSLVADIMTTDLTVAYPSDTLYQAFMKMSWRNVGRIPVVKPDDHSRMVGLLRRNDLIEAFSHVPRASGGPESELSIGSWGGTEVTELELAPGAPAVDQAVQNLALPDEVLLIAIRRGDTDDVVLPRGDTVLHAHDIVFLITRPGQERVVRRLFEAPQRVTRRVAWY